MNQWIQTTLIAVNRMAFRVIAVVEGWRADKIFGQEITKEASYLLQ